MDPQIKHCLPKSMYRTSCYETKFRKITVGVTHKRIKAAIVYQQLLLVRVDDHKDNLPIPVLATGI
jgi:hypothetical protein